MKTQKRVLIMTAELFEDMELYYPYYRLQEEDIKADVATPEKGKIKGKHGYEFESDLSIKDVNADDYDLLILPGGPANAAAATVSKIKEAVEITKSFFRSNKPVAAICHGPYTLIEADVIKDRRLTSVAKDGLPELIEGKGGRWVDAEVFVDANLITSRTPKDLPAFMREVLKSI